MGTERLKVALALQGGGSHGAFTWGVLDHLLEQPEIDIIGVTGTSAYPGFLEYLFEAGRHRAKAWLSEHATVLGKARQRICATPCRPTSWQAWLRRT
jgi:predicted patatin/cPLA2 family phospholipase